MYAMKALQPRVNSHMILTRSWKRVYYHINMKLIYRGYNPYTVQSMYVRNNKERYTKNSRIIYLIFLICANI